MELWNNIIQTAMLGTAKKPLNTSLLPPAMEAAAAAVTANAALDREEQFLQLASLAFNYRQAGVAPLQKSGVTITPAPAEEKPYCSAAAAQVLKDILEEDSAGLLLLWLQHCVEAGQLLPPVLLPVLLQKSIQQKALRHLLEQCMGHRGQWLCAFNANWQGIAATTDEERWQTGAPEVRKQVLQQVRSTSPAQAREWLQQTWPQESAGSKAGLLKVLQENLGPDDLSWLETVITEKSQKVKDEALVLLQQLPGSSVVERFWQLAQQVITLTPAGISIQLPEQIDEVVFNTGIDKTTGKNNAEDENNIIYQLVSFIPPHYWESFFQQTPEVIGRMLAARPHTAFILPAVGLAAGRFKNREWAVLFTTDQQRYYPELLPLLTPLQREAYLLERFSDMAEMAVNYLTAHTNEELSLPLAKAVLTYTSANPYLFTRIFYNKNIRLFPVAVGEVLSACSPANEYQHNAWNNTCEYIRRLLQLKKQTIQSFPIS